MKNVLREIGTSLEEEEKGGGEGVVWLWCMMQTDAALKPTELDMAMTIRYGTIRIIARIREDEKKNEPDLPLTDCQNA